MEYAIGAFIALLIAGGILVPLFSKSVKTTISKEKTESYMTGFNDGAKLNTLTKIMRTHSIKK